VGSSNVFQSTAGATNGFVGINQPAPAATLDVNGSINLPNTTSSTVGVLSLGGVPILSGFGPANVFVGPSTGNFTMTGDGANTAVGAGAFQSNTTGGGDSALGYFALNSNTTGFGNNAFGYTALSGNSTGNYNNAFGDGALIVSTGQSNSAFGDSALLRLQTGNSNIAIGANAGSLLSSSESSNIDIGHNGVAGESNTIRIGTPGTQTEAYIAGTLNVTNLNVGTCTGCGSGGGGVTSVTGTGGINSSPTTGAVGLSLTPASCSSNTALVALPAVCSATAFATTAANSFTAAQTMPGLIVNGNATATNLTATASLSGSTVSASSSYLLNNGTNTATVLASNTVAGTTNDVFLGFSAGTFTGSAFGPNNIGLGNNTLNALAGGADNTASGYGALHSTSSGSSNTGSGYDALYLNSSGSNNTAAGSSALYNNTAGSYNTAVGYQALSTPGSASGTTGSSNIAIGYQAGSAYTGSESTNIDIGSSGTLGESSTIHIGSTQTATFIAGINGQTSASGTAVFINAFGQLGTVTSSQRFKDNIADIGDESDLLMKLRPVTFYYKPELDPTHTRQYGLVAEEVAQVAPQLVVFDKDGAPETVRYHFVNALLLNEVQKQRQLIEEQQKANQDQQSTIARQQTEIEDLANRLAKLEARLSPAQ
jgi:trimeric autotransporter adhesin